MLWLWFLCFVHSRLGLLQRKVSSAAWRCLAIILAKSEGLAFWRRLWRSRWSRGHVAEAEVAANLVPVCITQMSGACVTKKHMVESTTVREVCDHVAARQFDGSASSRLSLIHQGSILAKTARLGDLVLTAGDTMHIVKSPHRIYEPCTGALPADCAKIDLKLFVLGPWTPVRAQVVQTLTAAGAGGAVHVGGFHLLADGGDVGVSVHLLNHLEEYADVFENVLWLTVLDAASPISQTELNVLASTRHGTSSRRGIRSMPQISLSVLHVLLVYEAGAEPAALARQVASLAKEKQCVFRQLERSQISNDTVLYQPLDDFVDRFERQRFHALCKKVSV